MWCLALIFFANFRAAHATNACISVSGVKCGTSAYADSLTTWYIDCGSKYIRGIAVCSNVGGGGGNYTNPIDSELTFSSTYSKNTACWCKLVGQSFKHSNWVEASSYSSTNNINSDFLNGDVNACFNHCAEACAYSFMAGYGSNTAFWRNKYTEFGE